MTEYTNHPLTGALMSVDRTIRANYDHAYVARYEKYPEAWLSHVRANLIGSIFPQHYQRSDVLDVGFGTGAFLREMHARDPYLNVCGYDVSPYPAPGFVKIVPDWIEHEWDLVTFFDSLEHFADLDWLPRLKAQRVVVSVPWYHPQMGPEWFALWKHRRPGEHLWHFAPETLTRTMAQAGLFPVYLGHPEDLVRRPDGDLPNILTMAFRK